MEIKLSSKGQVVLPLAARHKYHLKAGDKLQLLMKDGQMTLVPPKRKKGKGKMVKDPLTGMVAFTFGAGAPIITSAMVDKLLEDFP